MDSYCQGYITKDSYTVLVEVLGMWFKPGIQPPLSFFKINPQKFPPRFRNPELPPIVTVPMVCPAFSREKFRQVINEPHLHNDQEHDFLKSYFQDPWFWKQ